MKMIKNKLTKEQKIINKLQGDIKNLNNIIDRQEKFISNAITNGNEIKEVYKLSSLMQINHDKFISMYKTEFACFEQNVNEMRRFLLEIYRIMNKYDLYKVNEEAQL